jgi:hypothetical protein
MLAIPIPSSGPNDMTMIPFISEESSGAGGKSIAEVGAGKVESELLELADVRLEVEEGAGSQTALQAQLTELQDKLRKLLRSRASKPGSRKPDANAMGEVAGLLRSI